MPRPTCSMRDRIRRSSCSGAHRKPVARPDVGAEHHDAALRHAVEQGLVRGKARKAEEWRRRRRPPLAVEREFRRQRCRGRFRLPPAATPCDRAGGANSCDGRRYGPRPVHAARVADVPPHCVRAGRMSRARIHVLSASRTFGVVPGHGPSSNVSTSSLASQRAASTGNACGRRAACSWHRPR